MVPRPFLTLEEPFCAYVIRKVYLTLRMRNKQFLYPLPLPVSLILPKLLSFTHLLSIFFFSFLRNLQELQQAKVSHLSISPGGWKDLSLRNSSLAFLLEKYFLFYSFSLILILFFLILLSS